MHIKRFEAASVQEALTRIRSELGPDALILETRRASDGSGWFEVTAARPHDEPGTAARARRAYAPPAAPPAVPPARKMAADLTRSVLPSPSLPSDLSAPAPTSLRPSLRAGSAPAPSGAAEGMSRPAVASRVAEILSRLPRESVASALTPEQRRRFLGEPAPEATRSTVLPDESYGDSFDPGPGAPTVDADVERPASRSSARRGPAVGTTETSAATPALEQELVRLRERNAYLGRLVRSEHFSAIPLPLRALYLDLCEAEVDANLAFQILLRMGEAPGRGGFAPVPVAEILPRLESMIAVGGDARPGDPRRVIALVGPTGVGKTTTLAKIAGQVAFEQRRKVALVSTDAYRVFGAQHLGSYATLMGLPFATAGTSAEMRNLLEVDFADRDLILVDTSGRSPRDPEGIEEIHGILGACPEADVHLVLAANARVRDMAFALEGFSRLPLRHLIFTKLDETTRRGGLFTLALKARRPVSYLGTGQEVPDDLFVATPGDLTEGIGEEERSVA